MKQICHCKYETNMNKCEINGELMCAFAILPPLQIAVHTHRKKIQLRLECKISGYCVYLCNLCIMNLCICVLFICVFVHYVLCICAICVFLVFV